MAADELLLPGSAYQDESCLDTAEALHSNEENLLSTPPHLRTFTSLDMASLWWDIVTSISTFYVGGSLVEEGMAWWQGLLTIVLANIFQALLAILIGHVGAKFGIAFPIQCRASLGSRGAHFVTCLCGIAACGWFGIDTYIGGQALLMFMNAICSDKFQKLQHYFGAWYHMAELVFFFLFWGLQLVFVWNGVLGIRCRRIWGDAVSFVTIWQR